MRLATIRRFFSQKSKVGMQNFFEINPIYPTNSERDAVIFKEKRPTIRPLEHSFHILRRRFKANDYVEARIDAAVKQPSRKDKEFTKKIVVQAQTRLPLGMGFNWYIDKLKGRSSKNFSLRYVEIISDLIKKFELKNEPQLIRFFRLAIADSKSNDIVKQLKGSILQNVIKESVKRKGERQYKQLYQNTEYFTQKINDYVDGHMNNQKQANQSNKNELNDNKEDTQSQQQLSGSQEQVTVSAQQQPTSQVTQTQQITQQQTSQSQSEQEQTKQKSQQFVAKVAEQIINQNQQQSNNRIQNNQQVQQQIEKQQSSKPIKDSQDQQSFLQDRRREFYKALRQIDANIAQSQINLKIHQRHTFRHDLYDTNYDLPDERVTKRNLDADIANDVVRQLTGGLSGRFDNDTNTQNYLIQQRIKKLYFLKKLQYAQNEGKKPNNPISKKQAINYNINVGAYQYQIAKLADKYNILDIVPETQIDEIYNIVELFLSQLNLSAKDKNMSLEELKAEMSKSCIDPADYLWESIRVDRIFDQEYHQDQELQVPEEQKYNLDTYVQAESEVSPTPSTLVQTTLNNTPFNVYQHNDLGIFGQVTENRSFAKAGDILGQYQIDTTDRFRKYQFEIPKERKMPPPKKWSPPVGDVYDFGKRKSGSALCRIRPGTGVVNINKKSIRHYFPEPFYRAQALKPALITGIAGKIDIDFYIEGSGIHSQSQACCNSLSRALYKAYPRFKKLLRRAGLVTIDPRFKERKHSGHYKARKSYVYVRR